MWCAAGAWCAPYAISSTTLGALGYPGDALLCPTASSWASSCSGVATGPIGNDPMYGAQSWVYDLINVQSVWSMGYTGQGVQIAINDDGIDLTLPDFGGASKFDAAGSCIGAFSTPFMLRRAPALSLVRTSCISLGVLRPSRPVQLSPGPASPCRALHGGRPASARMTTYLVVATAT